MRMMNQNTGRLSGSRQSPSSSDHPAPNSARRAFIGRVLGGLAVAVPAARMLTDATPASAETVRTPETSTIAAGYTLVVAAENATAKVKSGADYVCSGTNDQTVINEAIGALPANGGTILLSAGTFSIASSINIASSNVSLEGTGVSTQFSVPAGTNISSVISVTGTGTVEVKLRRFFIQGAITDTYGDGVYYDTPWSTTDTQHVLEDVYITSCPNNGVHVAASADTRVLLFSRVHVKNCNGNGFYMAYPSCTDCVFDSCIADTIGLSGFYVGGANCNYISCKAFYCGSTGTGYGFQIVGYNNYFTRCEAQDNYQSGFYGDNTGDATYGSYGCTFVNCLADSNGQNGGASAVGFQINGSKEWQIIGGLCINRPYGSYWQSYGILVKGASAYTTISGMLFFGNKTSPINDTSTGPTFVNAPNYSGAAAPNTTKLSSVSPSSGVAFTPYANQSAMIYIPVSAGASAAASATITYGPSTGSENTVVSAAPIVAKGSALYSLLVPISWKVIVTVTGTGASIASSKVQPA
jgi:hypothetical protein